MLEIARRCVVKFETHLEVGGRKGAVILTQDLGTAECRLDTNHKHRNIRQNFASKFQSLNLFTDRQEPEQGDGGF